jgi:membrane peptidoglycan carboxypeptidase
MKQAYGFGWREHVRGVTTTLDIADNLAFHQRILGELGKLDAKEHARINPGFTLDPAKAIGERRLPNVVVVAANARGEIVRYFETGETAPYFGSPFARDATTGRYQPEREARHIASTGKIIAAIGVANEQRDLPGTLYSDPQSPGGSSEACEKGTTAGQRRAVVAFACSLNAPIMARTAALGQERVKRLVDGFGFTMPPVDQAGDRVPPSTASVLGLIAGSPRRVHQMAGVVLASLTGEGHRPVRPPTLVRSYDYTHRDAPNLDQTPESVITPSKLIRPEAAGMLKSLLSAPLCHRVAGQAHGTLRSLASWCADGRKDLRLHVAKTGTSTTTDPDATVDTWTAGAIQFANGAAYSYVVLVGTGTARDTWARKMHASQANVPLVDALLQDLRELSRKHPLTPPPARTPVTTAPRSADAGDWRRWMTTTH